MPVRQGGEQHGRRGRRAVDEDVVAVCDRCDGFAGVDDTHANRRAYGRTEKVRVALITGDKRPARRLGASTSRAAIEVVWKMKFLTAE